MRLRLAFKLHGDEADLARQIAEAAGVDADRIAKLAMQRYMADVLDRATKLTEQSRNNNNGQPSNTDPVHATGTVSDVPDSVSGETPGQP
jgi:hypothetical protein